VNWRIQIKKLYYLREIFKIYRIWSSNHPIIIINVHKFSIIKLLLRLEGLEFNYWIDRNRYDALFEKVSSWSSNKNFESLNRWLSFTHALKSLYIKLNSPLKSDDDDDKMMSDAEILNYSEKTFFCLFALTNAGMICVKYIYWHNKLSLGEWRVSKVRWNESEKIDIVKKLFSFVREFQITFFSFLMLLCVRFNVFISTLLESCVSFMYIIHILWLTMCVTRVKSSFIC
jgi:hypothetical protein